MTLASTPGVGLAQVAHLGGLLFGWMFMRLPLWMERIRDASDRRVRERARRSDSKLADDRRSIQDEVDHLLEKISREGMDKLTGEEQRRLVDASERLKRL